MNEFDLFSSMDKSIELMIYVKKSDDFLVKRRIIMSRLSKMTNEFFYAWGDNDPKKKVLRNGKMITLERLHGYDDYRYYKPRRETAGAIFIGGAIGLGVLGVLGVKMIVDKSNQK